MTTPSQRPPQFGQTLLPDRALVPCLGPRAAVSASRRSPVRPVASGWLAGSLQHRRFLPKVRGRWGNSLSLSSMGPRWTRQAWQGQPRSRPRPSDRGGQGLERRAEASRAGRVSRMGATALVGDTARGRGGVQASRVLCGSSVTSFTGSPWPVGRHIPERPPGTRRSGPPGHSAHPTCAHVVVCSLVHCKVTYGLSCTQHTQPLLLQFRQQHQDAHKSRICVPAGIV